MKKLAVHIQKFAEFQVKLLFAISKIIKKLFIPKGKGYSLHILLGIYIYFLCSVFADPLLSILIVGIIGLAKEFIWDKLLKQGEADRFDAMYTIWGGVIALLVIEGLLSKVINLLIISFV